MSSCEKKTNKNKYIIKSGNGLLSELNNFHQKPLNNIAHLKKDNRVKIPEINVKYSKLNPVIQNKQNNNNPQGIKNFAENSKTSLSKPKNENRMNSKYKLSKIITSKANISRLLDSYNTTNNTFKTSQLNSFKVDSNTVIDNNYNSNNYKNLPNTNVTSNSNSLNGKRNLNIKRGTNGNINSNNDSYYNNNFNDNSTNNSNLESKRETIGHSRLKTDINDYYLKTPNDNNNIKLVLPNINYFDKKLVFKNEKNKIFGTPYGLFRKNNDLLLLKGTPEIKLKCSSIEKNKDNNILNERIKLSEINPKTNNTNNDNINTIKPNKNEHIVLESISNSDEIKIKTKNRIITIDSKNLNSDIIKSVKKNKIYKCPEELHFYYISVIQEGKKNEIELEGE
jgi:hypothetical protein